MSDEIEAIRKQIQARLTLVMEKLEAFEPPLSHDAVLVATLEFEFTRIELRMRALAAAVIGETNLNDESADRRVLRAIAEGKELP